MRKQDIKEARSRGRRKAKSLTMIGKKVDEAIDLINKGRGEDVDFEGFHERYRKYFREFESPNEKLWKHWLDWSFLVMVQMEKGYWEQASYNWSLFDCIFTSKQVICGLLNDTCTCGREFAVEQVRCWCRLHRTICDRPKDCVVHARKEIVSTRANGLTADYGEILEKYGRVTYRALVKETDYLSLRREIALMRERIMMLLDQMEIMAEPEVILGLIRDMRLLQQEGLPYNHIIQEIEDCALQDVRNFSRWQEIDKFTKTLTLLSKEERARIIEAKKMYTHQEMMMLVDATIADMINSREIIADEVAQSFSAMFDSYLRLSPEMQEIFSLHNMRTKIRSVVNQVYSEEMGKSEQVQLISGN